MFQRKVVEKSKLTFLSKIVLFHENGALCNIMRKKTW